MDDYIKLTNANPNFLGKPILLRKELIVSVYEGTISSGVDDSIVETITYIFVPPHGEWQVKESVNDVLAKLRGSRTVVEPRK